MKTKLTLFAFFMSAFLTLHAQVVTEDVNFDFYQSITNNDFGNHFSGSVTLLQTQTNGITGGSLTTPDSIDWGNDRATYCTHYKPNSGDTTVTSVCFKYDSATVNLASFQRAATIFLHPNADFNHYVFASILGNKQLQLVSYSWTNNPQTALMQNNHWYRLQLTIAFIGGLSNTLYIKGDVFELGTNGTSIPSILISSNGTFSDNILMTDTSIAVSINGTTYGGCSNLDDFHFNGRKGLSSCINVGTAIDQTENQHQINAYLTSNNILHVTTGNSSSNHIAEISVYSTQGKLILKSDCNATENKMNLSQLSQGLYVVRYEDKEEVKNLKIVIKK